MTMIKNSAYFVCLFFALVVALLPEVVGTADRTFDTPGSHPAGLEFDGRNLWMADHMNHKIYRLDPETGTVTGELEAPAFDPRGIAWDGELLWCADGGEGWIYGMDPQSGISLRILESNSPNPGALAFDGSFLWLMDQKSKRILKINRRDGMMHTSIPFPSKTSHGLAFDGAYLWTSDPNENLLYRMDPASGDVVTFLPANGPCPYGLCWDGRTLWNADYQELKLYRLNLRRGENHRRSEARTMAWEIVQEFRNYGPGEVLNLEVFMAIPENLPNQDILGEIRYSPQPRGFVTDRWGQRFARFVFPVLSAGAQVRAKVKVQVRHHRNEIFIFPERVGDLKEIPGELKKFQADGFKYDLNHPLIKEAVEEAVGGENRPYWIMRRIVKYIDDRIEYNLKPLGGWNPAPTVLKRGTGSCSEYTFLFIALCRAAGLPARYSGAVVVRDPDRGFDYVWHRWAEVFLPRYGWVPVDAQAADNKEPGRAARYIGVVGNRFLITTRGGGDSRYLDSYYNLNARWQTEGKCRVHKDQYAEFTPL
jgi:transglutaminase-like putative cysteine protease/sugar lactone lactonase YvrE